MPDIPFIICIIVTAILLYNPFFGAKKDFLASLDAFLAESHRFRWFKSNDEKPLKMVLFLILAFIGGGVMRLVIDPFFK